MNPFYRNTKLYKLHTGRKFYWFRSNFVHRKVSQDIEIPLEYKISVVNNKLFLLHYKKYILW